MLTRFRNLDESTMLAMAGAAALGAQYIAGKAARDALFLTHFAPSALPAMVIAGGLVSIVLVAVGALRLSSMSPGRYVPAAFALNAIVLAAVWTLTPLSPRIAAPMLYLVISGVSPVLGSGFWLIASERFDPRTAKRRFGYIGAAGTIGGLLGGLVAARVSLQAGVDAVIPLLVVLNVVCAWQTQSWTRRSADAGAPDHHRSRPAVSGLRILSEQQYLRLLAWVMLLAAIAAGLLDYVFKVKIQAGVDGGARLGSFFSLYYAAISVLGLALQVFASRPVLEKLGLSAAMSAAPLSVIAGGTVALINPGLPTLIAARGGEAALHGSLLRAGYEVFYTPIATDEKRAVKTLIDVGVDRTGEIVAAIMIQLLLWTAVADGLPALLAVSVLCSLVALVLANGLSQGYVTALERGLRNRAVEIDPDDAEDWHTRTILAAVQRRPGHEDLPGHADSTADATELHDLRALSSRDPIAVRRFLEREESLPPTLVPQAIALLDWDLVAEDAVAALRLVAAERVDDLVKALTDPAQPFAVRRRLPRVFSACTSQRAVEGLTLGLEDLRFEVRVRCGRSLSAVSQRNASLKVDAARISAAVLREIGVSRSVWEGRRL
ncbi:MAG TPA: hypothetical protein VF491_11070, partial [Vicinamibacterales bacterium]